MIKSFIFDLDDTLLPYSCSREEFDEALIGSFAAYISQWVHPDQSIPAIIKGIEAIRKNRSDISTNFEVFSSTFLSHVDFPEDKLKNAGINYYQTEVANLKHLTDPSSYARDIMDLLFQNDFEVVIATGFHAPREAAELRLGWAGIPVTDYDYTFIATWDNMHTCKPHLEYYKEILDHIDRDAGECLFIGDSWEFEIIPATKLGILSYWVVESGTEIPENLELLAGFGQLPQLYDWITNLVA